MIFRNEQNKLCSIFDYRDFKMKSGALNSVRFYVSSRGMYRNSKRNNRFIINHNLLSISNTYHYLYLRTNTTNNKSLFKMSRINFDSMKQQERMKSICDFPKYIINMKGEKVKCL